MVPRADQTSRWAIQPGTPANKKKINAAASSIHANVRLCRLVPENEPFLLRRICPPPFFCNCPILWGKAGDCASRQAV